MEQVMHVFIGVKRTYNNICESMLEIQYVLYHLPILFYFQCNIPNDLFDSSIEQLMLILT